MSVGLYYFIAFVGAVIVLSLFHRRRRQSLLPPGPPGDPVIGHLLRMPSTDSALVFHQWSQIYGPVMHLKVLGRSMIILDTYQAAVDLLDKRGLIYSDRPKFTLYELLGWKHSLSFLQYGKEFNIQRQMHQTYLSRHKVEDFKPMQIQEARTLEAGVAMPSFILEQLEQMEEGQDMERLKGAAATMFAAGEATVTWSTLCIFILAMILHPECQDKAQKEIDTVVGTLRLPEFGDRSELPFVEGVLQETLRWRPAVPLVPHRVMEDNVYHGMLIPKGSLVFPNIKGMSLDESVYSTPTSFRPERYLPKPAGKGEPYFNTVSFGFGRRICTGQYLADNSLWIAIVSILATCKITNMVDDSGKIIVPESSLTDGLTRTSDVLSLHARLVLKRSSWRQLFDFSGDLLKCYSKYPRLPQNLNVPREAYITLMDYHLQREADWAASRRKRAVSVVALPKQTITTRFHRIHNTAVGADLDAARASAKRSKQQRAPLVVSAFGYGLNHLVDLTAAANYIANYVLKYDLDGVDVD
ncbi:Cytochrome P450 [Mycena venus]|uniref:Cytochrome P450 n=1 Tax=Mycena venus TaxID=2733690 RepID=A0A8H6Y518_9AGAR|nr:Cytochrome P450 [Mycena venus]